MKDIRKNPPLPEGVVPSVLLSVITLCVSVKYRSEYIIGL